MVQHWIDAKQADSFFKTVLQNMELSNKQVRDKRKNRNIKAEDNLKRLPK